MPNQKQTSTDSTQTSNRRLARGMAMFVVACLLMGLFFWALAEWFGSEASSEHIAGAERTTLKPATKQGSEPQRSTAPQVAPSTDVENGDAGHGEREPIQGPDAGQIVRPPSRNVTPSFQLSPLHQNKPLKRATGKQLPPPPKLPPLPPIFRKVSIEGPTQLTLHAKLRDVPVLLANVQAPAADRICHFNGQQAPCLSMGKMALRRFVRQRAVGCLGLQDAEHRKRADEEAGPQVVQCFLGVGLKEKLAGKPGRQVTDLAGWMVRYGWVIPDEGHYEFEHRKAQQQQLGFYAGEPSPEEKAELEQRRRDMQAIAQELDQSSDGLASDTDPLQDDDNALSLFSEDGQTEAPPPPPVVQ